jgi:hypothetical protein
MKIVQKWWRIIFPIVVAIIIWCFSSQNAEISDQQSLFFAQLFGIENVLARKLAHVFLFSLLGYSTTSFFKGLEPYAFPTHSLALYPIIVVTVYSAIDEVHQVTVLGRSGEIGDVILDTVAGLCGVLCYIAIFCFWRRWRIRRAYERSISVQ